jgi:hypothetical protein
MLNATPPGKSANGSIAVHRSIRQKLVAHTAAHLKVVVAQHTLNTQRICFNVERLEEKYVLEGRATVPPPDCGTRHLQIASARERSEFLNHVIGHQSVQ